MEATQDDNEFGTFLAQNTASLARRFGYVPLPSLAPSLSPLSDASPHLRFPSVVRVIPHSQECMRPTKELHLLDHCCRQHLRRFPTADDGHARCLVMEHPLHWCDGCGFILSITSTNTSATTWHDATSCCTHTTTTYWGHRCGLILSVSFHASFILLVNTSSSPRCQTTRKKKKKKKKKKNAIGGRQQLWFYDQLSAFTRGTNSSHTWKRVQSLQRSADNAIQRQRIASVTEARTVTTTYKGNNQRPSVTRVSTCQTSS